MTITIDSLLPRLKLDCDVGYDAAVKGVSVAVNLLTAEFTADKIRRALDAIGGLKALGPDSMPAVFFKKYWDVVSD